MTKELRDFLIDVCGLESDVKDRWLELTYPSLIAAYKVGYKQAEKDNATQWHYPSKGELPRLNVRVLVYNGYSLTIAHRWNFNWHDERGEIINCEIIAWQYLPELPKEM